MATEKNQLIYIVENNKVYNLMVTEYIKKQKFTNVKSIFSGEECVKLVEDGEKPEIVIQDYHLDGINGIDVLKNVKKINPASEFVFLTSNEDMEVAVNTIKYGAYDYIVKDKMALDKVIFKIHKIIKTLKLEKKNRQIRKTMVISSIIFAVIIIMAILVFGVNIFGIRFYT